MENGGSSRSIAPVRTILGATAALVTFCGANASAQTTDSARAADEVQSGGLADIVVTAQRRSERAQDVPASISVFSEEQLELSGVSSTRDLQLVTPSLTFVQAAYAPQPTIRGIGTRATNPGDEQAVPIYLDGVFQPFLVGGIFELNNVERIEVLKGPQGTLLGRNAIGGAINIITRAPSFDPEGEVTIGYGSFNERQISAYASAGTGPVAASVSAQYLQDDGYVRELNSGERVAALKSWFLRGKILFEPTDATEITLAANYASRHDPTGAILNPVNGNTVARQTDPNVDIPTCCRQVRFNVVPFMTNKQNAVSANIVQHFGGFDVTSTTGYSENELIYETDVDSTVVPAVEQFVRQYDHGFTQELYASSVGAGPFQWIVGGFYLDDSAGYDPRQTNASIINAETKTEAYAFYAQGSYELTDALTFTLGGRYNHDKKCASADNGIGTRVLPETCATWESFDPSGTIDYQIVPGTKVYARYAQAFKAGVFNAAAFSPTPIEPEKVHGYEVGIKSDPLRWVRINLAGFYSDYKDIQANTRDPVSTAVVLQNAASARIYGVEGEVYLRPAPRFNVRATFSAMRARYREFLNAQVFTPRPGGGNIAETIDASGKPLIRTPELTASLSGDYTVPVGNGMLTFSGNVSYQGEMNWQVDGRLRQPDFAIVNAQLAWRTADEKLELALWGRNITNVKAPLTLINSTVNDQAAYRRPATVGLRATIGL